MQLAKSKPEHKEVLADSSDTEILEYIQQNLIEIERILADRGYKFLNYLIGMAIIEISTTITDKKMKEGKASR